MRATFGPRIAPEPRVTPVPRRVSSKGIALVSLATLCVFTAAAQGDGQGIRFSVHSDLVLLPTRVQDKHGKTIYGLKAEQFMVDDNGERQKVEVDEQPDPFGLSLVVVVQCSRSAPGEFYKIRGLGAMIDAVAGAGPHEVAVLAYGEGPHLLGDFSSSPNAERLALSKLKPCGLYRASTIDAIYYAINMLRRRSTHYRRAILLISETRDHGSKSKLDEVVTELGVNDTVIYSVAFSPVRDEFTKSAHPDNPATLPAPEPDPNDPPTTETPSDPGYPERRPPRLLYPPQLLLVINALKRNSAQGLASLSGGEYFNFASQKGFERILDRISNEIHNYYLLRYRPAPGPIMTLHRLRVRVYGYPDAVVQTRKSYWSGIYESTPTR
jgi:VWFA-related protein